MILNSRAWVGLAFLALVTLLVVPALDLRYGWSVVPIYWVVAGDALMAIGFYFIFLVYKEKHVHVCHNRGHR